MWKGAPKATDAEDKLVNPNPTLGKTFLSEEAVLQYTNNVF
jgi:hypothetical protein